MKNLILSLIALVTLGSVAFAKNNSEPASAKKVIVMVNTAKWCPACKANGERVEKNIISAYMNNEKVQVVVNDLSDETTKAASKEKCEAAGITSVAEDNNGTGMIYFIDSETKKIISEISVTKTDDEIKAEFEAALARL